MKQCFKCKVEKDLSDFYKHKQMADGHLNKCKACTKKDARTHRNENLERIRKYDRARGNRQHRDYKKDYRKKFPAKCRAQNLVASAIKKKNLIREPCEECGSSESVHAHHDDYMRPLKVRWLCASHHRQWHEENGEGLNGSSPIPK